MLNSYLIEKFVIDISKKCLNGRLLSNDYKHSIDNTKFVYECINKDNLFEGEKQIGKFFLDNPYASYQEVKEDYYYANRRYDKESDSEQICSIEMELETNNKIIECKPESKLLLCYDMYLDKFLKPEMFVISNHYEKFNFVANRRKLPYKIIDTRIKKLDQTVNHLYHYKVIERITLRDLQSHKKKYKHYQNFKVRIDTAYNPHRIIYENAVLKTDKSIHFELEGQPITFQDSHLYY